MRHNTFPICKQKSFQYLRICIFILLMLDFRDKNAYKNVCIHETRSRESKT